MSEIKIWAHRGCSARYPENTLEAFEAAAKLPGITGVELDVQLTKDGEVVVFHDERVTRVTDGDREVREYTLAELKALKVCPGSERESTIPTFEEVLRLLAPYCKQNGLMINVELKTSVIQYEGIEEKTHALVQKYDLVSNVVYSSFWEPSVAKMKEIDPSVQTGMLDDYLKNTMEMGARAHADALHPSIDGLQVELTDEWKGKPVRAWNSFEPFYQDGRLLKYLDLEEVASRGITDIFTNVPEEYLV